MSIQVIRIDQIKIDHSERMRKEFSDDVLSKMQESIGKLPGLMQAIGVQQLGAEEYKLIFGETRLKSIEIMHEIGLPVFYNGAEIREGLIPAIIAPANLSEVQLLRMELEENTIRQGFTFIEEQTAISRIYKLEQQILTMDVKAALIAAGEVDEDTDLEDITLPSAVVQDIKRTALTETVTKAFQEEPTPANKTKVTQAITIANAMENPVLAEKLENVQSHHEAKKVIDRHVREENNQILAQTVGKTFNSSMHKVIHGDCLVEMKKLLKTTERFDVCCTDPIYGIGANKFSDAAGKMAHLSHDYDDSYENFCRIMPEALKLMTQLMKPAAHVYLACDIRNYFKLSEFLKAASDPNNPWHIPNAPVIQYKIGGGRVPIPGYTFRRSYELWLYAYRGNKQEYRMLNDVIECSSDKAENHGAAKPIDLLKTFLARSALAGNSVLDFMAGSGGILLAAHQLKMKCTAIEIGETNYGNCVSKLNSLK